MYTFVCTCVYKYKVQLIWKHVNYSQSKYTVFSSTHETLPSVNRKQFQKAGKHNKRMCYKSIEGSNLWPNRVRGGCIRNGGFEEWRTMSSEPYGKDQNPGEEMAWGGSSYLSYSGILHSKQFRLFHQATKSDNMGSKSHMAPKQVSIVWKQGGLSAYFLTLLSFSLSLSVSHQVVSHIFWSLSVLFFSLPESFPNFTWPKDIL